MKEISPRVWLQTIAIASSTLQFGYHMAELNAPLPHMACDTSIELHDCISRLGNGALASSIYAIGGVFGSSVGGPTADRCGRRQMLLYGSYFYLSGSIIMVLSHDLFVLALGRFLAGIGAGISIVVGPMFICEIAPKRWSGLFGATSQVSVTLGISLAQLAGLLWVSESWRKVFIIGTILALFNSLILAIGTVESPSWLHTHVSHDAAHRATEILQLESADELATQASLPFIEQETSRVSVQAFLMNKLYRHRLYMVAGMMMLQQFSGINAIIFYGVSILRLTMPSHSELANFVLSLVNLMVTIIAAASIDKFGRKMLLRLSLSGMALSTAVMAFALNRVWFIPAIIAITFVIVSFAIGLGPIPFFIISELVPPEALGSAQSVGTMFNWLATFLVGTLFPPAKSVFGNSVFYLFSLCCAASMIGTRYLPEGHV